MKICYLALLKESYQEDLEFTRKLVNVQQTYPVVFFFATHKWPLRFLDKRRLEKFKGTVPSDGILIITTEFPAPSWVKQYPRLNRIFINGKFDPIRNYSSI